jgi:hypothetical protein
LHRAMIRSALVCAAAILVVIGATQPADAGSRWHPRERHSDSWERHSHSRNRHFHPWRRHPQHRETQHYRLAVFEWHQIGRLGDEVAPRLRWLREQGFTTVYADFGEYIEAGDQPAGDDRDNDLARLDRCLRPFVAYASRLGFEVHAVGGAPNWLGDLDYLAPLMVELVGDYNRSASREQRLRGLQLDIEPHADHLVFGDTIDEQRAALLAWLHSLEKVVDKYLEVRGWSGNRGLRLGFAIPFWFDDEPDAAPAVEFPQTEDASGLVQPATFHLFDMLADLPDAYVVVLSYRTFTEGDDGSIAHAQDEFDHAEAIDARFGIVVGQEFTNVRPSYITFWCRGRAAFREAAAEITDAFDEFPQFRGLAVNDMDAYKATPDYVVSSRSRIMGGWRTWPRCHGVGAGSPFVTST